MVLNKAKSTVALTPVAAKAWDLNFGGLEVTSAWDFLGTCLGANKDSDRTKQRLCVAHERLARIGTWPGTYGEKMRLCQFMVTSVLYGLSFELAHFGPLLELGTKMWTFGALLDS